MLHASGVIEFQNSQRESFKSGDLITQWANQYPSLFDSEDYRLAVSQGPRGYHFYEWLAAVVLHHTHGYLSLIEKYELPLHVRKYELFTSIAPQEVQVAVFDYDTYKGTQAPDLFVYAPDHSDWFFCEVKGKGDRLSALQREYFEYLAKVSNKPVRVLRIKEATLSNIDT